MNYRRGIPKNEMVTLSQNSISLQEKLKNLRKSFGFPYEKQEFFYRLALSMLSYKINRILSVALIATLAICLRTLHLALIQRDAKILEAQKPQSRTLIDKAPRGTICDRFGIPLAINRISYNAAIYYNQMAQIPSVQWKENQEGRQTRIFPRKNYIASLAKKLSEVLDVEAERIEDQIHSKASLFPNIPFVFKSRLSEEEYYRLKALEKEWPGVHAEASCERFYPLGKTACHILGTMGRISAEKYGQLAEEMHTLEEAASSYETGLTPTLPKGYQTFEDICSRLKEIKEKSYTLNDFIGKSGIEGFFEESLRGFYGKKTFEIDQKGSSARQLPGGRPPVPGWRITLSISAELQQFAEELLAISEQTREGRSFGIDPADKKRKAQKQPWIKGGALVAIEPNSGEILAMASFPRFDPNDFIQTSERKDKVNQWLENKQHLGDLWDGGAPLNREKIQKGRWIEESVPLSWDFYLDGLFAKDSPCRAFFHTHDDLRSAIQIQEDLESIAYFSKKPTPLLALEEFFESTDQSSFLKKALAPIPDRKDQLFLIDLCRLAVDSTRFSDELIAKIGSLKLSEYKELSSLFFTAEQEMREASKITFRQISFGPWRKANQKEFLKTKRAVEKKEKKYARPYLDALDQKEKELFTLHWQNQKILILREQLAKNPKFQPIFKLLSFELSLEFLRTFRRFAELDRPLLGLSKKLQTEQDLAAAFYPKEGFGYLRSYAFQSSAPLGSLFKVVTAYEGLRQGANLTLVDDRSRNPNVVAYALNGTPYPRMYKGGRLPRSSAKDMGFIDLAGALEQTSNPYFSILAGDFLANPEDLVKAAKNLGFGEKSGISLPGEATGHLPNDTKTNRTSLYSFAFGQHTLLSTPLQASVMLNALVNGGKLIKPKIVEHLTGLSPDREALSSFSTTEGFVIDELRNFGIPFALFTGAETKKTAKQIGKTPLDIRREIPLPSSLRTQLFEGMDRCMWSAKGSARPDIIRSLYINKPLYEEYVSLRHQLIGKTSTAEILYQPNANPSSQPQIVKYIWFGSAAFSPEYPLKVRFDHPELVVVVFLRFGDAGKEAAPLVTQMVKKWREIKALKSLDSRNKETGIQ